MPDAGARLGRVAGSHMNSTWLGEQGQLPDSDLYIVYSMSNSPYQQWQADLLDFSVRKAGQPGVIVRLCSREGRDPDSEVQASAWGYTFATPSYAGVGDTGLRRFVLWSKRLLKRNIHGRFHFYCLNKAHAMQAFLESHPDLDDEARLLWLDPDMVFNRPWDPPASMVRRGHVTGQHWWGYDPAWCQRNGGNKTGSPCPVSDLAIMFPFCITVGDMRAIVEPYGRYSADVYHKTRDWLSEMYALVMAMSAAELECHTIAALGTCNNWPDGVSNDPSAPISHYTQVMKDSNGREVWDKRRYTPHTLSRPWQRPPHHEKVTTLTDQRTLQMIHWFIDWQYENMDKLSCNEISK